MSVMTWAVIVFLIGAAVIGGHFLLP